MKKKIVSILLCVTMVAAMAVGCGSKDGGSDSKSESGDSKDKKYKVGITIQSLSNAYWAGVMGKLEEQLKDKGWDYTLIDCEDNSATQVSQIENFITSGCDLIMVHPSDAKAVENICKEALDADIKVMCWAVGSKSVGLSWADADCVLLAPQSASELSKIEEMVHGVIPCALINDGDFASMNGDAVLNQALDLIKK